MRENSFIKEKSAKYLYEDYYRKYINQIVEILEDISSRGGKIAIWGYGLKGIAFLNSLKGACKYISKIIDIKPELIGKKYKNKIEIIDYSRIQNEKITDIFIINGVFFVANTTHLSEFNYTGNVYDLDDIIYNKINKEYIKVHGYHRGDIIPIDYSKIHVKLLEIILLIDKLCKKYKINYFLEGGSALGAVRHNGFIPWDDDADVGMLRNDYERFREIIKRELPSNYFYQTIANVSDYYQPYDQIGIIDSAYVIEKSKHLNIYHGIHVDIFPYDYFSETDEKDYIQWLELTNIKEEIYKKKYKVNFKSNNFIKCYIVNIKYYNRKFVSLKKLLDKLENGMKVNLDKGKDQIGWWFAAHNKFRSWNYDDIFPVKKHNFEGVELPIPANYDVYLKKIYGDYMKCTPEAERRARNKIVNVSFSEQLETERL